MKLGIIPRLCFKIAFVSIVVSTLCLVNWQSQFCNAVADPLPLPFTATVDTVSRELTQMVEKQSASWNRGDIAEFMLPYWNDDRLTFSSNGKTKRGWQATYENYKKNYPDRETMGKLTFSELETQELGPDAMLMLGTWHLERATPIGGNFSLVWKRIDSKWLIVHDHSSAVRP